MNLSAPSSKNGAKNEGSGSLPQHVAIIMDGNGRWATASGLPRAIGHERGVEALRKTVEAAQSMQLSYMTVYSFSTENWRRPAAEVSALFALLKAYVKRDLDRLTREGVRIRILGTREGLPDDILALVTKAENQTKENTSFTLAIAFNYGGREEIVRAAKAVITKVQTGQLEPEALSEDIFAAHLDTADMPDPDLVIRTSGEYRLSNFLIWQAAYAELVFMDVLWPDFRGEHLREALDLFQARERRYGGLGKSEAQP